LSASLKESGELSADDIAAITKDAEDRIQQAVTFALDSPYLDADAMVDEVFS